MVRSKTGGDGKSVWVFDGRRRHKQKSMSTKEAVCFPVAVAIVGVKSIHSTANCPGDIEMTVVVYGVPKDLVEQQEVKHEEWKEGERPLD